MDLIRRTIRTFVSLVIAIVFACALAYLLAMLVVYGLLLAGGEPMPLNPGILAGALWVGAMQGVSILPVALPLGALLHIDADAIPAGRASYSTSAPRSFIAAMSVLFLGVINGFAFNAAFAIMAVLSGVLGGSSVLARPPSGPG